MSRSMRFFHYEIQDAKDSQIISDWNRWIAAGPACPYSFDLNDEYHRDDISKFGNPVTLATLRDGKPFHSQEEVQNFIKKYFLCHLDEEQQNQLAPHVFENIHQGGVTHASNLTLNNYIMSHKEFKYLLSEPKQKVLITPTNTGFQSVEDNTYCQLRKRATGKLEPIKPEDKPYAKSKTQVAFDRHGFTLKSFDVTHDKKVKDIFTTKGQHWLKKLLCSTHLPEIPEEPIHIPLRRR